ncbi:hypothetical protein [Escherichia fergusonii]|uniref:hypothetical protein n=1 Tax=Escherichia fergusonii TaxID=564 RepID=UPI001CBD4531|nr:hypothetical protein [Escherichia fergusonii]
MEQVDKFTDLIASYILTFRTMDSIDNELICALYKTLEDIQLLYCDSNLIDKEIAYGLLVLHDNLQGAMLSGQMKIKPLFLKLAQELIDILKRYFYLNAIYHRHIKCHENS